MAYTKKKWIDHITDSNGSIIQQGTPLSASNLNNIENGLANAHIDIANNVAAIRESILSGMTKLSSIDYTYMKTNPNKIKLTGGGVAFVNGFKIDIPDGTIIDVGASPTTGERDDLVFLEVWKDQYTDTAGEKINSRIRVVQGIDFTTYAADGFSKATTDGAYTTYNKNVTPQGGNNNPLISLGDSSTYNWASGYTFNPASVRKATGSGAFANNNEDVGLYVAGTGTTANKNLLKTADGYVYAIPLFRVKRRNSGGYNVNNPNGGLLKDSVTTVFTDRAAAISQGGNTIARLTTNYSVINVGDMFTNGYETFIKILEKLGNDKCRILLYKGTSILSSGVSTSVFWKVDRTDLLTVDIIDDRDILDLRHQVSLTGFNYQVLLEENFDKLLRGELQTKDRKKMLKVYHGIPKTPIDANTVFYASLDGAQVAEVGGVRTGFTSPSYTGMPTGFGIQVVTGDSIAVNNFSGVPYTVDAWVLFKAVAMNSVIFDLVDGTNTRVLRLATDYAGKLMAIAYAPAGVPIATASTDLLITAGALHQFRLIVTSTSLKVYINSVLKASATFTNSNFNVSKLCLGSSEGASSINCFIADVSISNIDRGTIFATLPADFIAGYARIDKAMNGQRKTHSDALTPQYTIGIAKSTGTGHSKGLTVTQATLGTWSSGDTIKVKGLAGEIISGVIDSDTALARVVAFTNTTAILTLNDVSGIGVNDTVMVCDINLTAVGLATVTSIDTAAKTITLNGTLTSTTLAINGGYLFETTASTSVPVVKFMNSGTLTSVTGIWANLGTNEATFTLGTNALLVNADVQIEYSLNMAPGQGGIPEVYTATLAGEAKGKKLTVGTVAVMDDLKNKVVGDGLPLTVKWAENATLLKPSEFPAQEVTNADYVNMGVVGDGNTYTLSTSVNGEIAQALLLVDLVKEVEAKYGPIPSVDKVGWLKNNVNSIVPYVTGFGAGPNGNKLNISGYYVAGGTYNSAVTTTNSTPTEISRPGTNADIDSNGIFAALVYTDPSNGTIASSITIDSFRIEVSLKFPTGYDMLVPENPRRDDGLANVLLVRKETKEIQSYFDAVNTDGLITYGEYLPYQGITTASVNCTLVAMMDRILVTSLGTGGVDYTLSSNQDYKGLISRLPMQSAGCLESDFNGTPATIDNFPTTYYSAKGMLYVPVTTKIDYGLQFNPNGTISAMLATTQQKRGFNGTTINVGSYLVNSTKSQNQMVVYGLLVIYNNEIYLIINTYKLRGTWEIKISDTTGYFSRDIFKIDRRPLG